MKAKLERWSEEQLANDAEIAASNFRAERLAASQEWESHYQAARAKFEGLFRVLANVTYVDVPREALIKVFQGSLGGPLRYLSGPPVSEDDLEVLAEVDSLTPSILATDPRGLARIWSVISTILDRHRMPWVYQQRAPTDAELETAIVASSVLLASQTLATERRNLGKTAQEGAVMAYLQSIGMQKVPTRAITTLVNGPQANQFCGECLLGDRKADIVVRLHDSRLMPIECKVSNSKLNSVKRLNNDAAVKAEYWFKQFGEAQVVPVAMLSGVFSLLNLSQAQQRGLGLFWAHDLDRLGDFISSTA